MTNWPYTVRESARAKHVRLRISPAGGLVVTIPRGFDPTAVPALVASKRAWIDRTFKRYGLDQTSLAASRSAAQALPEHLLFRALDEQWSIAYREQRHAKCRVQESPGRQLVVTGAIKQKAATLVVLQRWVQGYARARLIDWLAAVSDEIGIKYERCTVRNQKTRWGSCSSRGTISLNQKLLYLPPDLVRYVMIHELCHRVHLNHSQAFWQLVAHHMPAYHVHDQALRTAGRWVPAWQEYTE